MKPKLDSVTLLAIDCTPKAHLAERALKKSLAQCDFAAVKLLTNSPNLDFSEIIPSLKSMPEYSEFCIRHLHKHFSTSHCLIVQHDGYVLNGAAWNNDFLHWDYLGPRWVRDNTVGNGGFSLRSKRLLEAASRIEGSCHPEDQFLCRNQRPHLQAQGLRFAPPGVADQFAVEGADYSFGDDAWHSDGRIYGGQFGFHSFLTPLSNVKDRPLIFHHSGDLGDIIYSLPVIKMLGGGILYLSSDNAHPWPSAPRVRLSNDNVNRYRTFFESQPYVWQCRFTPKMPHSVDVDLNAFREYYRSRNQNNFASLFSLHQMAFDLQYPQDKPWLDIPPVRVDGRPIVINRTFRYNNHHFPWTSLCAKHHQQMVFVGLEEEHQKFQAMLDPFGISVPHRHTWTVYELAQLISGCEVFIGNQSTPMAIALGLGKNVIQECWPGNPNCCLQRQNAVYWGVDSVSENIDIPAGWLTVKS